MLTAAAPAAAQRAGAIELGGFGRYTIFDDAAALGDLLGGGARAGIFFTPHFGLELDAAYTDVDGLASYLAVHARLFGQIPLAAYSGIVLAAGAVRNDWHLLKGPENGASALVGLRVGIGPGFAFRLDVSADHIPTPSVGIESHTHWGVQAGASLLFRAADPDRDRDGVAGSRDRCPGTPPGAEVDDTGCPAARTVDHDADGVPDVADRCAATPVGQSVDDEGCPVVTRRDGDLDGVPDSADRCPATRAGEVVDETGCPLDDDRDGVPNRADRCPGTPAAQTVDILGCPRDADGDRIPDDQDRCPETAFGEATDESGCALPRDADGDGVADDADRCSATPRGTQTDHLGCPPLFPSGGSTVVLAVAFESGSPTLTPPSAVALERVAQWLAAYPEVRVEIGGHTDAQGGRLRNVQLSLERAHAVRDYLLRRGIAAERMQARGYGPERPIATNATSEGRERNRRVELRRLP